MTGGSAELAHFVRELPFALDDFQVRACSAIEDGHGVLVAAPTGAGKTIVGEYACHLALGSGVKAFYTTPIKALSNQKFADLCDRYGRDKVGLLTGDSSINGEAPIVVMTTEVLRNMIYAESPTLEELGFVVMDEVHYLADRTRGAVWEEVIIHLPRSVRVVSLSATISNAEEFGAWLRTVRGDTDVIVHEVRPVPLVQHMLVGDQIYDLFESGEAGAQGTISRELMAALRNPGAGRDDNSAGGRVPRHRRGRGPGKRGRTGRPRDETSYRSTPRTSYPQMVARLDSEDLLPGICFIFSRQGCEKAADQCRLSNVRLTNSAEAQKIRSIVTARCADLPAPDLRVLGFESWVSTLTRGVAAHHAGMLPTFKSLVEELFEASLVKMVFATETLALGINMPARSVVLDKLVKFNGETHVEVTAGEYTQLTGRAGRRGLDTVGHAVVSYRAGMDPGWVGGLASARTYPLKSSFRPSYNMAVNLVERLSREAARKVLQRSFAQFQADRSAVDLAQRVKEQTEALDGYAEAMRCHLGDFADYAQLRQQLTRLERKTKRGGPEATRRVAELRRELKQHPCHGCKDREHHARWAERWHSLRKDTDGLLRRINKRTGSMVRLFDQVCEVLVDTGYFVETDGTLHVTGAGETLRRLYSECDLLLAECLRQDTWTHLDAPSLAGLVSALVYSGRGDEIPTTPHGVSTPTLMAWQDMSDLLDELHEVERARGVPLLRTPDPRAIPAVHAWAAGASLEDVLSRADISAGDFVRLSRQVIDVLDQIRSATPDTGLQATAVEALDAVDRGVVGYAGTTEE